MKALFFDIDGIKGIFEIPEGVRQELKRIQNLGHKIFISSARPKAMINEMIRSAGFDGYVLANGDYVEINGQSIYEDRVDYDFSKHIIELLEDLGCDYMIETANHIYLDPSHHELYDFFAQFNHNQADMFIRDFDLDDVLKRAIKIEMNILNKDKERVEQAIQKDFMIQLLMINMAPIMLLSFTHPHYQKLSVFKRF